MLATFLICGLLLLPACAPLRGRAPPGAATRPETGVAASGARHEGRPAGQDGHGPSAGRAGFGFRGFEIYKVGEGTSELACGDFDGDGLGDLALIDNRRSRVEVLRRLPKDAPDAPDPDRKSGPNALAYDGRFERSRHPVERRVLQLAAGDWNRDRRDDLAWVSEGGELTVLWSDPKGGAARESRRTLDALRAGCGGMLAADFDGDGRTDLLLLAPDQLLALPAGEGDLGDPVVLDRFESAPSRVFLAQLDGHAGPDLLYAYLNADSPLRYRLSRADGAFGPRVDVEQPQMKSVESAAPGADGRTDVLAVFKLSGRLSLLSFSPLEPGRRALLRHALGKGGERGDSRRSFACGDLDGDGAADVLVAEPETASITAWFGTKGAQGLAPRTFPSLTGVRLPHLADVDGDGRKEVVCVSGSERMLGVARSAGGRELGFPVTSPIDGEPVALDVADLDGDGRCDAVVLVAQGEGRARKHRLEVWPGKADGTLGAPRAHPLEGLKKTPNALRLFDLDRDGKLDALAFAPGEKAVPALLLSRDGSFIADERGEDAPGLGILAGVGPDSVAAADVDGDGKQELLVAQANFVRALAFDLDASGRAVPRVVEQSNVPATDARLSGAAFVDWNGDGTAEIVVRDETTRELLVLERAPGGLRISERVWASRLEFGGMVKADLDGDGRADLVVYARDQIGLLYAGARESGFEEAASYEPREERVSLDQLATGDLGGDARPEVIATEITKHALVILEREDRALAHALGFEVFEKKSFEDQNPEREPREIRCADIDGDRKTDLALIVHDKLIVYLQE